MLDFDAAIAAHRRWKDRIRESIVTRNRLDPAAVARDDQCELGHWIHAKSRELGATPEFQFLKEHHTKFHLAAADTVRDAATLPEAQALALLGPGTPYHLQSAACVAAIAALGKKYGAAAP